MKYRTYLVTCLLVFCLFNLACEKDNIDDIIIIDEKVTTSVFGIVTDESNNPIQNATVKLGIHQTQTDEYGIFLFLDVEINTKNSFVSVSKSEYYNGIRTFQPIANTINRVKLTLLDKIQTGIINSENGGTISTSDGAELTLYPNSISNEDGSDYNGPVHVFMKFLNPINDNFLSTMPGDLTALNINNEINILQSFGMLAVELKDDTGNNLNIKTGQFSKISIPLDSEILQFASSSIPLWFFNESTGLWNEEEIASLENNRYVGEVTHFTYWNYDAPFPLARISGKIMSDNIPVAGTQIKITIANSSPNIPVGYGITDANGDFIGNMPAEEQLILEIIDDCNQTNTKLNIGPFLEDTNIGTLNANLSSNSVSIKGTALDCDLNPINHVLLAIKDGNNVTYHPTNISSFTIPFMYCNSLNELGIKTIDFINQAESEWLTYNIVNSEINLGNVSACNDLQTEQISYFINYTDETEYVVSSNVYGRIREAFGPNPAQIFIDGNNMPINSPEYFTLSVNDPDLIDPNKEYILDGPGHGIGGSLTIFSGPSDSLSYSYTKAAVNFSRIGELGEFITGTCKGYIVSNSNDTAYYDAYFNVIRE